MMAFLWFYAISWNVLCLLIVYHDRKKIVNSYRCNRAATGRNPIICALHAWFWYVSTWIY